MNENLNLIEILKDCPKGTKLYSPIVGEVEFQEIIFDVENPINTISRTHGIIFYFTKSGKYYRGGECILFPSRENRDWSKFKVKKPKFDPKTLMPFDRVLVFNQIAVCWACDLYSHKDGDNPEFPYICVGYAIDRVIPYNEDTKHLVGTSDEAPEFYRYWED